MRKELETLFYKAIVFQYSLPYKTLIDKTVITTKHDYCYKGTEDYCVSNVIYNGIVDYAYGETNVDINNLNAQQRRAIKTKIRYQENDSEETKVKYGFYGEVILNLIIEKLFGSTVLVAKGYFYNPTNKEEVHGYDAFHSFYKKDNGKLCLIVGESKFYQSYSNAVEDVIKHIQKATSEDYFNLNYLAIMSFIENHKTSSVPPEIINIFNKWRDNPDISIWKEVVDNNITLFYPILIVFDKPHGNYSDSITAIVESVNKYVEKHNPFIQIGINIMFIFLTVGNGKTIKKEVIKWISENKPVI